MLARTHSNRLLASILLAVLMMAALLGFTACGSSQSAPAEPQAAPITVQLKIDGTEGDKGIIFDGPVQAKEGDNVYDVLVASEVDMSAKQSMGMGAYVESIGGLSEQEKGPSSGWTFEVNGKHSTVSSDEYKVADGDKIEWTYKVDGLSE